jgi:type IV secretion system protein VirB2
MKGKSGTTAIQWAMFARYFSFGAALLIGLMEPSYAGGFDKVTENATSIQTMLKAVAVIAVTIAIIVAGYKIAFSGARFQDVWGILLGGTLIGGASGLAGWIATPD